jgi:hypothetical protein
VTDEGGNGRGETPANASAAGDDPLARPLADLRRVTRFLLFFASAATLLAVVAILGWMQARRRALDVDELPAAARAELVEEMLEQSPGVFRWAWFEPEIGFTLRPNAELAAWGDTFRSNELGYRTGPAAKDPGTLRVVFVGDSWTFGMGVREEESFPKAFERVANRLAGESARGRRVEAWSLALPGYNTHNELAALWFFWARLQPDAVVICPVGNDNHSGYTVLPNGSTSRSGVVRDELGARQSLAYGGRGIASFLYRERWRRVYDALADATARLEGLGVPSLLFFVASLQPEEIHAGVLGSGIEAPYVIVPNELTKGRWRGDRFGHATPEAYEIYGRMVYAGLAKHFGWPDLPAAEAPSELSSFDRPPPGDWSRLDEEAALTISHRAIAESFRAGASRPVQTPGLISRADGIVGRATSVLVRARRGDRYVHLELRRLDGVPHLYPLPLRVTVPSPAGGVTVETVLPGDGEPRRRLAVPIPEDLPEGAVLDVMLETGRAAAAADSLAPRSLYLLSVDPSPDSLDGEPDALAPLGTPAAASGVSGRSQR